NFQQKQQRTGGNFKFEIRSIPQEVQKKRWKVFVTAPQGAGEKTNETIPTSSQVRSPASDLQPYSDLPGDEGRAANRRRQESPHVYALEPCGLDALCAVGPCYRPKRRV